MVTDSGLDLTGIHLVLFNTSLQLGTSLHLPFPDFLPPSIFAVKRMSHLHSKEGPDLRIMYVPLLREWRGNSSNLSHSSSLPPPPSPSWSWPSQCPFSDCSSWFKHFLQGWALLAYLYLQLFLTAISRLTNISICLAPMIWPASFSHSPPSPPNKVEIIIPSLVQVKRTRQE